MLSVRFCFTAIFALTIFVTELPTSRSKAHVSEWVDDNEIRREVNDGFTITKEDKDFFEQMNNDIRMTTARPARIVAGQDATLGELPYQCAIQFKSTGFSYCGGALIDPLKTNVPKYVATAAHCVKDRSADALQVVCGGLKMSQTKPWNRFQVETIHQHSYDGTSKIGDVALLQLKVTSAELQHRSDAHSNGMIPIKLPEVTRSFSGQDCIVSGWGRQVSGGATKPDTLNRVDVLVPSQSTCQEMYTPVTDKFKEEFMICAGGHDHDACQGDSGGPLMCKVDGEAYLAGLVSWGIGCATEGIPGCYTNVAHYTPWIIETITNAENHD